MAKEKKQAAKKQAAPEVKQYQKPLALQTPMQKKFAALKEVSKLTIEITKNVGGMEIGTQKTVPASLANAMVKLGNAKLI